MGDFWQISDSLINSMSLIPFLDICSLEFGDLQMFQGEAVSYMLVSGIDASQVVRSGHLGKLEAKKSPGRLCSCHLFIAVLRL